MNFRGSGRYIPRYDTTPPPESESEEDVGDLNFDDVFAHGHDQQRQQHRHQNNQHGQRLLQQQHGNQPRAPPAPAADPGHHGIAPQDKRALGYWAPGGHQANANANHEEEEQLIFDLDLEDDVNDDYVYNDRHHRRRHAAPPVEDGPGENLRRRQEYIEELSAEVVRQQRYVNHLRDKLQFGPFPEADGGREGMRGAVGMAQEALRTLREALMDAESEREQRGDRLERGDRHRFVGGRLVEEAGGANNNSGDELERRRGRGRARRRQQGPDPTARRQTEQNLAQLRETEMQMRWAGATPEDLRHVVEEIQYLQDVLDGRYLTWGRGKSLSPSSTTASASSTSSSPATSACLSPITSPPPSPFSAASPNHGRRRRHRRRHRHHRKPKHDHTTGCYHPFPALSQQDPRLPPGGVARTEPVELHDAEGPRHLALVTLDNPDPAARRAEEQAVAQARRAFARYEAGWFTVVQRALACRALTVLSVGPRGAICAVQEGRPDVLGAILKAREEPFGVKSWTFLGVGVGGAEGFVFCLHKPEEEEKGKKEGGGDDDDLE